MGTEAEPLDHNGRHMQTLSIHHCCNNTLNMTFFCSRLVKLSNTIHLFYFEWFFAEMLARAFVILSDFCID